MFYISFLNSRKVPPPREVVRAIEGGVEKRPHLLCTPLELGALSLIEGAKELAEVLWPGTFLRISLRDGKGWTRLRKEGREGAFPPLHFGRHRWNFFYCTLTVGCDFVVCFCHPTTPPKKGI